MDTDETQISLANETGFNGFSAHESDFLAARKPAAMY